jgi:hypothetical protein
MGSWLSLVRVFALLCLCVGKVPVLAIRLLRRLPSLLMLRSLQSVDFLHFTQMPKVLIELCTNLYKSVDSDSVTCTLF